MGLWFWFASGAKLPYLLYALTPYTTPAYAGVVILRATNLDVNLGTCNYKILTD